MAGYTFDVSAASGNSISFQPGNGIIREFVVVAGYSVHVDGFDIPLKAESRVALKKSGSDYVLSKIRLGESMFLRIEKKGKVKEREVKAGRKLVIENGKIVKATL